MKIRLHGTTDECAEATRLIGEVMEIRSLSHDYPDCGQSVLVRVYIEAVPK